MSERAGEDRGGHRALVRRVQLAIDQFPERPLSGGHSYDIGDFADVPDLHWTGPRAPPRDAAGRLVGCRAMRITRPLLDEMVAHAEAEAPNECCGMIASRDGQAVAVHRAVNKAASALRYEIDGLEQYRIQMEIEDAGLDLGAIYHSHTRSAPYPSQTDINLAFYPEALYVIVGLHEGDPDVKAYTIRDGQVAEVELDVV